MGTSWNRDCKWAFPECLKGFRRGCVDYFTRQFVLKLDSPNCEGELATARTASLLLELVGVVA